MKKLISVAIAVVLGGAFACAKKTPEAKDPAKTSTTKEESFANPGGMWMPQQLTGHKETLEALGLAIPAEQLANPQNEPLSSVIWLGGCTASFVSPKGLVVTNHHCITSALQFNSKPESNLMEDGYYAGTMADEVSAGPSARAYVTQKFSDVSEQVLAGLEELGSDRERFDAIEKRQKELVAACEKDRPDIRCRVASYFEGAQFQLIEQLEIRDVRLVYAPHRGVGVFGGEIDNWMWPRHTGDFAFYRVYVGADGKPADFSKDNVPYQPKSHLKVATDLSEGDLVMVAGYPGRTYRHKTAYEVSEAVNWRYPRSIDLYGEALGILEEVSKASEETAIKAQLWIRGLGNALKNNKGMMDGLEKGGLAADKERLEGELSAWIAADDTRKAEWGDVLPTLHALYAQQKQYREKDSAHGRIMGFSSLMGVSFRIAKMAEQRQMADADRDPSYQERNWKPMEQRLAMMERRYDQKMDKALFTMALRRANRLPQDQQPEVLHLVVGKSSGITDADITKAVDRMYANTKLEDASYRMELFKNATPKSLKRSKDPFIQLALKVMPIDKVMEDRSKQMAGALAIWRPKYIAALRAFHGGMMAPDANSTLRVTYGTVRGYKPKADAEMYHPFTYTDEMVAKDTGKAPFDTPAPILEAAKSNSFGPYPTQDGKLPLNFLSDVDTTGGNSGSPTLNGRGELVGLLFDGNYESMASDWLFIPEITRSIHVDIRYVLWVMDIAGADRVVSELGFTPSL